MFSSLFWKRWHRLPKVLLFFLGSLLYVCIPRRLAWDLCWLIYRIWKSFFHFFPLLDASHALWFSGSPSSYLIAQSLSLPSWFCLPVKLQSLNSGGCLWNKVMIGNRREKKNSIPTPTVASHFPFLLRERLSLKTLDAHDLASSSMAAIAVPFCHWDWTQGRLQEKRK